MTRRVLFLILLFPWSLRGQSLTSSGFEAWPVAIEKRIFPGSYSRDSANHSIKLTGCRFWWRTFFIGR